MDDMLWRMAASVFNSEKIEVREESGRLELLVKGVLKCAAWSPGCSEAALTELMRSRWARIERPQARAGGESVHARIFGDDEPVEVHRDDELNPGSCQEDSDDQVQYDASTGVVRLRVVFDDVPTNDRCDGDAYGGVRPSVDDGDDNNEASSR